MRNWGRWLAVGLVCGLAAGPAARAQLVQEDPLEVRVRDIAQRLRCPVCQGENVYDSRSPLAGEMRAIIRERLAGGEEGPEIIRFFVDRYGDYVRLEPRWRGGQLAVWLLPAGALVAGLAGVTCAVRRRAAASARRGAAGGERP